MGMIRAEIMDLVDIDAILGLFRSAPRVMEVPKYVEKVVDNVVTIPQSVVLDNRTASVASISKTEVVKDRFSLPLRQDHPVEMIREVPVVAMDHL